MEIEQLSARGKERTSRFGDDGLSDNCSWRDFAARGVRARLERAREHYKNLSTEITDIFKALAKREILKWA
ncbi:MAG TPA: hypothetical protein ENN68_08845 [Methanomicrobia archaeon]|nr:hypothetical protein [Methanomicrobia archaeon]